MVPAPIDAKLKILLVCSINFHVLCVFIFNSNIRRLILLSSSLACVLSKICMRGTCLLTWHYIPEDIFLHSHHRYNLKLHFLCYCVLYYCVSYRQFLTITKAWSYRPESRKLDKSLMLILFLLCFQFMCVFMCGFQVDYILSC